MVMEGMAEVPKFLHLSSTAGTTIVSPFSSYTSLLMTNMWYFSWRKKISVCDYVLPHVDGKTILYQ